MTLAEGDPRHGSLNGYDHHKCRCDPCRQAKSEYARVYRAATLVEMKEYKRLWHQRNAEKIRDRVAKWRLENPERTKEIRARQYVTYKEKAKANALALLAAHPERRKEYDARYQKKHPEKFRAMAQTRRARLLGQWVEHVDHIVVWDRDGGICHICKEPAEASDWHLDHVIPLALGGEHSYANTAVSHSICNRRKGARLI